MTEVFKEALNSEFSQSQHEAELAQMAEDAQHLDTAQQLEKEQLGPIAAAPKLGTRKLETLDSTGEPIVCDVSPELATGGKGLLAKITEFENSDSESDSEVLAATFYAVDAGGPTSKLPPLPHVKETTIKSGDTELEPVELPGQLNKAGTARIGKLARIAALRQKVPQNDADAWDPSTLVMTKNEMDVSGVLTELQEMDVGDSPPPPIRWGQRAQMPSGAMPVLKGSSVPPRLPGSRKITPAELPMITPRTNNW